MHGHGMALESPFYYQRPVIAMKLTAKFIQKVMKLFEKDFHHFPKFLLKCMFTKSASLL